MKAKGLYQRFQSWFSNHDSATHPVEARVGKMPLLSFREPTRGEQTLRRSSLLFGGAFAAGAGMLPILGLGLMADAVSALNSHRETERTAVQSPPTNRRSWMRHRSSAVMRADETIVSTKAASPTPRVDDLSC